MKPLFYSLILVFICTNSLSARENTEVTVTGKTEIFQCELEGENLRLKKYARIQAVINAEVACPWDQGRPKVKRMAPWKIDVICKPGTLGEKAWGLAVATTTFRCLSP